MMQDKSSSFLFQRTFLVIAPTLKDKAVLRFDLKPHRMYRFIQRELTSLQLASSHPGAKFDTPLIQISFYSPQQRFIVSFIETRHVACQASLKVFYEYCPIRIWSSECSNQSFNPLLQIRAFTGSSRRNSSAAGVGHPRSPFKPSQTHGSAPEQTKPH